MSALATGLRLHGDVTVVIALDEQSHLVSAAVSSSPSAFLVASALAAAQASVFQTTIRNCQPVAARFRFIVSFPDPEPHTPPDCSEYFLGRWSCVSATGAPTALSYTAAGETL
jgi:hypothetical protein